ncbi:response regulator [Natrinema zhouii]|uniref:Response regulator n=1 Tax=Natrinema zhouii TaxID=1710539 RepID=A0A7D6GTG5_9EURY|nr:response regulator [Natrinema zhouii]QLK27663.1 response regulator [Natrinema zhouii]
MSPDHGADPSTVLLIEDNPGDVHLMREGLEKSSVDSTVTVVTDGEAALDYVSQCDVSDSESMPDLVFLDLNLPKANGRTVLEAIEREPRLRSVPVIICSSSKSPDDIRETAELGADGYHIKPVDPNEYISLVRTIAESVSDTGRIPPGEHSAADPVE